MALPVKIQGENDLARILVKEGIVKAKVDSKKISPEQQVLMELEAEAKDARLGLHGSPTVRHEYRFNHPADMNAFLAEHKGKQLPAFIEQVRDGSTYRVAVMIKEGDTMIHQFVILAVTGIKSPLFRKDIPGFSDLIEPFGEDAKQLVESRLLQKDVHVVLEGVSNNIFIGSVRYPLGNIALALVKEGLSKVQDWSLGMLTDNSGASLRSGELEAKSKRLRIWKDLVSTKTAPTKQYEALVTRIQTADTLQVEVTGTNEEKKISFSSLRAPKLKEAKEAYYHTQAKEFLRSKLIGKKVIVTYEFTRPAHENMEARDYGTVRLGDLNVAEALISKGSFSYFNTTITNFSGLAFALRHKKDDENRSTSYDALLVAEEKAKSEGKGVHSSEEAPSQRISDVSESAAKARQFLPFLQRQDSLSAVIEHCISGSRFKVYIPSQNCKLTFVLLGIKTPRVSKEKTEPFGQEALDYSNRRFLQRDVEIQVDSVDKVGGFIGTILLPVSKSEKLDISIPLLKEGLATIQGSRQLPRELNDAEEEAKKARKGIWSVVDPYAVTESTEMSNELDLSAHLSNDTKNVIISEIADHKVYLQVVSPG